MIEHLTRGIVFSKEPLEDGNCRYAIFTEELGKIYVETVNSRKITSKLAAHLEPASFSRLRIVPKKSGNGFKLVDALLEAKRKEKEVIRLLNFLDEITPVLQPDPALFSFLESVIELKKPVQGWERRVLKIAGFDPEDADCGICARKQIVYFSGQDIMFLCRACQEKIAYPPEKLITLS